jgi:hypothetical protein
VLKRINEDFVIEHGFIISFVLLLDLIQKQLFLDEGVIELCVGIAQLVVVNEQLETLSQSGFGAMVFGQGRHKLWVLDDEGRVFALGFDEVADQLVNQTGGITWSLADDVVLGALFVEELTGFFSCDVFGQRFAEFGLEFFHHTDSSPRWGEINLKDLIRMLNSLRMMLDDVAPINFLDHLREHIFSQVKQVMEVSISHVEFATCVLGVMSLIDGLIPEVPTDFVDSIKPTDDQLLEEELRSDSHIELHIQIVVVSHERSGSSTSRNHIHHRGLNLEEVEVVEVSSHELDNLGSGYEVLTGAVVHNQIEETLSVTSFSVLQADAVFGDHVQARGEQLGITRGDR